MKHLKLKKRFRRLLFLLILLILFVLIIVGCNKNKTEFNYKINNVKINQSYNKEKKYYEFVINYENKEFKEIIKSSKKISKEIINNVSIEDLEDYKCLNFDSDSLKLYKLCYSKDEDVAYTYILPNENTEKIDKIDKIDVFDYNNQSYAIWNKSGVNIIKNGSNKKEKLFKSEVYDLNLAYLKDNLLVFANYDQEYNFDSLIIYNLESQKKSTFKLGFNISFNSYFMGEKDKSIYLYDLKNKKEYEIVPYKERIREVDTKVLVNGEWEKKTSQSIINNKPTFTYNNEIKYELLNNELFANIDGYRFKISNYAKAIIKSDDYNVYYLKNDSLYVYNLYNGEKKLMTYFEWNFNYKNSVFVY